MAAGLLGGLQRIGWSLPVSSDLAELHGPMMVSGFFGTLISLERAVALKSRWTYLAPGGAGIGVIALLADLPPIIGLGFFVLAALILMIGSLTIVLQQPTLFTLVLMVGAASWLIGNLMLFLGRPIPSLVAWWLSFFVCTIGAERLELSRYIRPPILAERIFFALVVLLLGGAALGLHNDLGTIVFALGLMAFGVWLWRYDIARRTVRQAGKTRYFAVAMLGGYVWLAMAGLLLLIDVVSNVSYRYDMVLHLVLIGFVLSMVFAHALIILPAVTAVRLVYSPWLYLPLAILHLSVLMRLIGGLAGWDILRRISGGATLTALIFFAGTLIIAPLSCRI